MGPPGEVRGKRGLGFYFRYAILERGRPLLLHMVTLVSPVYAFNCMDGCVCVGGGSRLRLGFLLGLNSLLWGVKATGQGAENGLHSRK